MELRNQTQSFFMMLACMFFFVGCGSYQVEGEDERLTRPVRTELMSPYPMPSFLLRCILFIFISLIHKALLLGMRRY